MSNTNGVASHGSLVSCTTESSSNKRPRINAGDLNLARVSDLTVKVLAEANVPPFVFSYGECLAVVQDENGQAVVRRLTQDGLRHVLSRIAWWYKQTETGIRTALPPLHVVRDLLVRPDLRLPVLYRIVPAPVFAPDGTIQLTPGYHPQTRCYYAPADGLEIPPVSPEPSPEEISQAVSIIKQELLSDFPFVSEADRAHAVALLLLPFVRELIDGPTPLHLIEKPTPGTGGTLLADVLTLPFLGHAAPVLAEASDESEWRKRITAKLMTDGGIVLIDNLKNTLDSAALSAALTTIYWEDRELGHTRMVRLPVRAVWIATGNNPELSHEIARRTVRIRVDSHTSEPWRRLGFRHPDLRGWIAEHRPEVIWACLTVIQAWIAAGQPEGKKVIGSFERWAKVIGGILGVVGIDGFLGNTDELYEQSGLAEAGLRRFVELWWLDHRDSVVGVTELHDIASPKHDDPIDLNLGDGGDRSQRTRLGKLLAKNRNRRFGDLVITPAGNKNGAQQWKLVKVSSTDGDIGELP